MRAALTERAKWVRPSFYIAESDVFTGSAAGTRTRLQIQARKQCHLLITGATLLRTLNPANNLTAAPTTEFPGSVTLKSATFGRVFNKGTFPASNLGSLLNSGYTWPDYIYLKPLELFEIEVLTTNTNEMRLTLQCNCIEYLFE
jgi:hypothetical protein